MISCQQGEPYRSSSDKGSADALARDFVALGRARARARLAVGEPKVLRLASDFSICIVVL